MTSLPRKRMRRWETPAQPRFITFSCEGRLPLLGNPRIRAFFGDSIAEARLKFHFELFAWVAMPEHAHLLVRPRAGAKLEPALRSLKLSFSKSVIARWRMLDAPILHRITRPDGNPRFWLKGGGFDRNVRDEAEFSRDVTYIHRNPVERGLVEHPEDWAASSVHWWMGLREGQVECDPPPGRDRNWAAWRGFK